MASIDNRGNLRGSHGGPTSVGAPKTSSLQGAEGGRRDGLRKELHKAVGSREAADPEGAGGRPARSAQAGGLNERIAKKPYRVQTRTGANTAGVRIVGTKVDPRINNQGRIAHPVFGGRAAPSCSTTPRPRATSTRPLAESAPRGAEEVVVAMRRTSPPLVREDLSVRTCRSSSTSWPGRLRLQGVQGRRRRRGAAGKRARRSGGCIAKGLKLAGGALLGAG
jgi:hypothetical protein